MADFVPATELPVMRHLLQQSRDWDCMEVVDLRAEVEDDVFYSVQASPRAARGEAEDEDDAAAAPQVAASKRETSLIEIVGMMGRSGMGTGSIACRRQRVRRICVCMVRTWF